MPEYIELNEQVTFQAQMEEKGGGPVILINTFTVKPEEVDQFLQSWAANAEVMKRQPGFISTQMHRGIAGSAVFVNYAIWESPEHYKQAFNNPELQAMRANVPSHTKASLHFFRKVAVPGICVAS